MSKVNVAVPCSTGVAVINEIEARQEAFQLVVATGHKATHSSVRFELWEGGNPLPHSLVLKADGTWILSTEIDV